MDTIWMSWISLVPRVISDAAEKRPISASEKRTTFENSRRRRSRPIPAPVREATNPTATLSTMLHAAKPSMAAPVAIR